MYERFISSSMLTGWCRRIGSAIDGRETFYVLRSPRSAFLERRTENRERPASDVKILYVERVVFDELPAGLDLVAHQRREHQVGFRVVFGAHLQQRPHARIHRRFPELLGTHLAEALVAVHGDALLARG